MRFDLTDKSILPHLYEGRFGLERETLRTDSLGRLAQTPHPFGEDEELSRDFCENQLEIITPVTDSPQAAVEALAVLHRRAAETLRAVGECLWPFSNPPFFGDDSEIQIARFEGSLKNKQLYRQYLAEKYGKRKMLFSGIHLNFSFTDGFIDALAKNCGGDRDETRNTIYLTLASRLTEYSWLLVLLNAASSAAAEGFLEGHEMYSSPRCSEEGYWNDHVPILDYGSLFGYCSSIQKLINEGKLVSVSELYYPIRLKSRGENSLESLILDGCDHIELRMYDIDPLTPYGILPESIEFARLLMLYLLGLELPEPDSERQISAIVNMKRAALFDTESTRITAGSCTLPIKQAAAAVLEDMERFFEGLGAGEERLRVIAIQKKKLEKGNSPAEMVREIFGEDYQARGTERAHAFTFGAGAV